jgi:hypothetical protein
VWVHQAAAPQLLPGCCPPPPGLPGSQLGPTSKMPKGAFGDVWRCDDCRRLWRIGASCDACDSVGQTGGRCPRGGAHPRATAWRPARLWQRYWYSLTRRRPL